MMTDEQIIKAHIACSSSDIRCDECPYYEFVDCRRRLEKDILGLAQQPKAEVERLKAENERLSLENERLTSENEDFLGKCGEFGARIMILKAQLATARADAVRVFADTVIERIIRKKAETSDYWQNDVKRYRAMQGYADIEHEADNFLRGYNEAVDDVLALLDFAEMTEGEQ